MNDNKFLQEILLSEFGKRGIEATNVPSVITSNLNQNFQIRPYQERAFQYFINYWNDDFEGKPDKHQLLFRMATGSGKTLMMAGLILYLYDQGYRNFLFFVNSTNIINKTRDNFLNSASIKFLFNERVVVDNKNITLREVNNFQAGDDGSINIAFSTIQGLHTKLNNPQENSLTYDDFKDKKIVLISDEAHHINVETKAGLKTDMFGEVKVLGSGMSKEEVLEVISWENTVNKIYSSNPENVLLEFTATVDFSNERIADKYANRLIFDYPLKQFRIDGYSKDVKVLQSDEKLFDRALQAVLLNQYRRKIFEKNNQIIKPVLLFKSKTIDDSKNFQSEFTKGIEELTVKKIVELKSSAKENVLVKMFQFFENAGITLDNLVTELKEDFSKDKTISVNSSEESVEKQIAVNTLEDQNNGYRVVFAVDKLNEGWDVLNLFDIVRLYDTRDSRSNHPGETTIKEAQLIGRGARYCPFKVEKDQELYKRKYDEDLKNELRICEELYYHSTYNPKYIQELNSAMVKTGIISESRKEQKLKLKDDFKNTKFYKSGLLFLNEQEKYSREDVKGIPLSVKDTLYKVSLRTGYSMSAGLFDEEQSKTGIEKIEKTYSINNFDKNIVRKALHKDAFFTFTNLSKYFPNLSSFDDFISDDSYLKNIKVTVSGLQKQIDDLQPDDVLFIVLKVLEYISAGISGNNLEYRGTKEFKPYLLKDKLSVGKDDSKHLSFASDSSEDAEFGKSMNNAQETAIYLDLSNKSWYVFNDCFGTSEEKYFVKYVDKVYKQLKDKYDEIYLVRNERFFKLYNFNDGQPLEPDYVLFLSAKSKPKNLYYQVFIEPKGGHLKEIDSWKQEFLTTLKNEHKIEQLWDDRKYSVWGMPFYTNTDENKFDEAFKKELL